MDDNIKIEHITNGRVSKSYESTVRKTFQYIIEWVLNKDDLFSTNNREDFGVLFQIKLDTLPFNIQLIEANKSYLKWMYSSKTYVTFDYRRHWRRKQLIEILK